MRMQTESDDRVCGHVIFPIEDYGSSVITAQTEAFLGER